MLGDADFWSSPESPLLMNPRLSEDHQKILSEEVAKQNQSHCVWLLSSGTESSQQGTKIVCLPKAAILAAAQSVVDFFSITEKDRWLCSIPQFHIGGLAIKARCFLAGAQVEELPGWDPQKFSSYVADRSVTIASLVPTQVYDLVEKSLIAPKSLRFVLVGGGALRPDLYHRARQLGWPVIPSYGMTETSALLASAKLESLQKQDFPEAHILKHIEFQLQDDRYALHSEALFRGFLFVAGEGSSQWVPRPEPFFLDDRIEINKGRIKVLGRESELIKVLGESVNIVKLEQKIANIIKQEVLILPIIDERKGYSLYLAVRQELPSQQLENLNNQLLPFERVEGAKQVAEWPRNAMGKIQRSQLIESLKADLRL